MTGNNYSYQKNCNCKYNTVNPPRKRVIISVCFVRRNGFFIYFLHICFCIFWRAGIYRIAAARTSVWKFRRTSEVAAWRAAHRRKKPPAAGTGFCIAPNLFSAVFAKKFRISCNTVFFRHLFFTSRTGRRCACRTAWGGFAFRWRISRWRFCCGVF